MLINTKILNNKIITNSTDQICIGSHTGELHVYDPGLAVRPTSSMGESTSKDDNYKASHMLVECQMQVCVY
jgi:hypothetical protein